MRVKVLRDGPPTTYACVLEKGEEFVQALRDFAKDRMLTGSHFTAIGAFSRVTLGYFDRGVKDYKRIPVDEQVEVLSLIGNIALAEGGPKVHAHVVLGKSDGTAHGGHILDAQVWPTLEVILEESPTHLQRRTDRETGLALIDMSPG